MTIRTSAPPVWAGLTVTTKSPFFERMTPPASAPVRSSRSPEPRARSASIASRRSSKSAPLADDLARSAPRAAAAASIAVSRSFNRSNSRVISTRNWCIGRVLARRIEEDRELRRVAVEVRPEQRPHPPDRAVALRLVEQLADVGAKGALVAEEPLQRPRQAPVAIGEVGAERLVERLRGPHVDLLRLADELLELRPDDVDVDRDAGILEREEADLQRPLDERRPLIGGSFRQEGRQYAVANDETLDHDPVRVDADLVGRELDDSGFHDRDRQGCL